MTDNERRDTGSVVLLGPQPLDFADVGRAVDELDIDGKVALITAGWQENESDDSALRAALNHSATNLFLHARSEEVAAIETDFVAAWTVRQKRLRRLQEFYRLRLEAIDTAACSIAVRHADPELLESQVEISVSQLRHLDNDHLRRCAAVRDRFNEKWQPSTLSSLADQRGAIAEELEDCAAMIIGGGHVVAVLNRLRLFDVFSSWGSRPIVAWSAGAMVLTDNIILFHDSPPFGTNLAQALDSGFGLCPGLITLPDMARRVDLDQQDGIGRFARRMAPAQCLALNPGSKIRFEGTNMIEVHDSARLEETGQVRQGWSL